MKNLLVVVAFSLFRLHAFGQEVPGEVKKNPYNFSLNVGAGWYHYFNTLKIGASRIDEEQVGFSFRFLWEPEHRLSMGFETGYYTIYTFERSTIGTNPLAGKAKLSAIPILLCFKMRVFPDVYVTGGPGIAFLYSEVSALGSTSESNQISLANLQISLLYQRKTRSHVNYGGEIKYISFGKTEDSGLAIMAVVAYKFRVRKEKRA